MSPRITVPGRSDTAVNEEELVIPGAVILAIVVAVKTVRDTYIPEGAVGFAVERTMAPFCPRSCLANSFALFAALWTSSKGRGAVPSG